MSYQRNICQLQWWSFSPVFFLVLQFRSCNLKLEGRQPLDLFFFFNIVWLFWIPRDTTWILRSFSSYEKKKKLSCNFDKDFPRTADVSGRCEHFSNTVFWSLNIIGVVFFFLFCVVFCRMYILTYVVYYVIHLNPVDNYWLASTLLLKNSVVHDLIYTCFSSCARVMSKINSKNWNRWIKIYRLL
jgi:hypothetical protein